MRKFKVNVNGKSYSVEVEEEGGQLSNVAATPITETTQAVAAPVAAAPAAPIGEGTIVKSPMPGLVLKYTVNEGATVKKNDVVLILEAMKMETDIVAPTDGTISFIAKTGTNVVTDAALAVIK